MKTRPHHIIILIIVLLALGGSLFLLLYHPGPSFPEKPNVIVKIKDVESSFGTLENYQYGQQTNDSQTYRFDVENKGHALDLGTQIIKQATKEDTKNLFEIHVQNILETNPSEDTNLTIGEQAKILKVPMPAEQGLSTFYILFYKNTSFVILTLNFARQENEAGLVDLAKTIEKRLD